MGRVCRFAERAAFHLTGLVRAGLLVLGVLSLSSPLLGQAIPNAEGGFPTDWSHHHLVFSAPQTVEQLMQVQQDPRYWQQLARRTAQARMVAESEDAVAAEPDVYVPYKLLKRKMHRDWQQDMNAGAAVGAGQYPAKYSFSATKAYCLTPAPTSPAQPDYVVFNTGLAGSGTQASVIAYTNLYVTGCTGTTPQVYWAYNTGGTVTTSVELSADGTQVAFVQTPSTGSVQLVVLKWKASTTETASAPMTLTSTAAGSYRTCTAPCMTTLTFADGSGETGTIKDTNSSPYYDFAAGADADTLYVGDDQGYVHQFTGVFKGTPTETDNPVASPASGWPSRAAVVPLSSPVFDPVSGNLFVSASYQQSNDSGGRIHAICVTTTCGATSTTSGTPVVSSNIMGPSKGGDSQTCHAATSGNGTGATMRVDTPLVDSVAQMVYVFIGNDGTGASAVYQFGTAQSSISLSCGKETTVGTVATVNPDFPVFAGSFDNLYFTSSNGSSPTGNLYVCGNASGGTGVPTLYQIPITANAMATTSTSVLAVSNANTTCSPISEIYNGSTDYAFLSVVLSSTGSPLSCSAANGCLMSFSLPTTTGGTLPTAPTATLAATGGTSGLIVDNIVASGTMQGASQVYFSPLSNQTCNGTTGVGCAIQASQAKLQ